MLQKFRKRNKLTQANIIFATMNGNEILHETTNIVGNHPKLSAIIYMFGWVGIGLGFAATELENLSGQLRVILIILSIILAVGAGFVKREEYKYWKKKNKSTEDKDNLEKN